MAQITASRIANENRPGNGLRSSRTPAQPRPRDSAASAISDLNDGAGADAHQPPGRIKQADADREALGHAHPVHGPLDIGQCSWRVDPSVVEHSPADALDLALDGMPPIDHGIACGALGNLDSTQFTL